jgi:UPF0755 protein
LSFYTAQTTGCVFCYLVGVKPVRVLLGVLALVLVGCLVAGAGILYAVLPTNAKKQTLEVKPGMSIGSIAAELEQMGLVRNAAAFRLIAGYVGTDRRIREGYYDLSGQQNALEIARTLGRLGRPRQIAVAIPEGWRMNEIVTRIAGTNLVSNAELETAFRNTALLPYTKGATSLEGFLFPATYQFRPEDTAQSIAKAMTERFVKEVTPSRLAAVKQLGLSVYQWVTLASIVQAEAGNTSEMPIIAGVFLNRLEMGMALQSDPTIAYGLKKRLPELNRRAGDFESDTPYNTYKVRGLTPTPISNPGEAALAAVLLASRTNQNGQQWLYFLHGKNGEFKPNTNFAAHQRDNATFR